MSDLKAAINGMRWASVNRRKEAHLWLGQETACGLCFRDNGGTVYEITIYRPEPECRICRAYAQGWVDRHEFGPKPEFGEPDPLAPAKYLAGAA